MNNINIKASSKTLKIIILYSRKSLALLKILYRCGAILNYYFFLNKNQKKLLCIYPAYYNKIQLTKNFRLITTPSRTFFISLKGLKLLHKKIGTALYILSTPYGLLTHRQALKKNIGGLLIGFLFV